MIRRFLEGGGMRLLVHFDIKRSLAVFAFDRMNLLVKKFQFINI
jgi:hypothetical protein